MIWPMTKAMALDVATILACAMAVSRSRLSPRKPMEAHSSFWAMFSWRYAVCLAMTAAKTSKKAQWTSSTSGGWHGMSALRTPRASWIPSALILLMGTQMKDSSESSFWVRPMALFRNRSSCSMALMMMGFPVSSTCPVTPWPGRYVALTGPLWP